MTTSNPSGGMCVQLGPHPHLTELHLARVLLANGFAILNLEVFFWQMDFLKKKKKTSRPPPTPKKLRKSQEVVMFTLVDHLNLAKSEVTYLDFPKK